MARTEQRVDIISFYKSPDHEFYDELIAQFAVLADFGSETLLWSDVAQAFRGGLLVVRRFADGRRRRAVN